MSTATRAPRLELRSLVKTLWATDGGLATSAARHVEHVLPTGLMHLVFRLSPTPLCIYDETARTGRWVGSALVGGARSRFYVREVSTVTRSVGAQLLPGAASVLFNVSAEELAERHTELDALWGSAAEALQDALLHCRSPEAAIDCLEQALLQRVSCSVAMRPPIARALHAMTVGGVPVSHLVQQSGISHRAFIEQFRHAVGLSPKMYARIARFQAARAELANPQAALVAVASAAGYADQAHFTRDFKEFAGVSPLRARSGGASNHLVVRQLATSASASAAE